MPAPLSVLILTFNEESNITQCLEGVCGWAQEVWVLDSFSTDKTLELARKFPEVKIKQRAFDDYSSHTNWALENIPFACEWLLALDADEYPSRELKDEITKVLQAPPAGLNGFYINRRVYFLGRWIKHCGWYPNWLLRLFKHPQGRYEKRKVNQHLVLKGKAGFLKNDLIHDDHRGLTAWIARHNQYSTWEAQERLALQQGKQTGFQGSFWAGPVERKRFLREKIYYRLPFKPLAWFLYLYVLRLGFLDGRPGLALCILQAAQEYHIYLKLQELKTRQDARR